MYGTHTLADLFATRNAETIVDVGMDTTWDALRNTVAAHNRIMMQMGGALMTRGVMRSRRYGGNGAMEMEDLDETGMPRAQKFTGGVVLGFPLNAKGIATQWTEMFWRRKTIADLVGSVEGMMNADVRTVILEMKRAFYRAANYTHNDHLVDELDIGVKRLANADGLDLPVGPNGETFDASTHTHYLARVGTLAASDVDALIFTVRQHYSTPGIQLWINEDEAAAIRGFTAAGQFIPLLAPNVVAPTDIYTLRNGVLDVSNLVDRKIGEYNSVPVYIKPFVPSGYMTAINLTAGKPLFYRYDNVYGDGLQFIYENGGEGVPATNLHQAKAYRRIFGIGVNDRVCAAHLYVGGTTWSDPVFTATGVVE